MLSTTTRPMLLVHPPHSNTHKAAGPSSPSPKSLLRPSTSAFPATPTYIFPHPSPVTPASPAPPHFGHMRQPLAMSICTDDPKSVLKSSQEADDSIPRLREALRSVETKLATMAHERQRLVTALEQAVRVQSPVQRLPRELLANMFTAGVLAEEDEDGSDPLLLSSIMLVCKHWRDVAVDTPTLWANITIGPHHSLDTARERLARSKDAPLEVSIDFSNRSGHAPSTPEEILHAMDVVSSSIPRWRSFRLNVATRSDAHAALAVCQQAAPLLETLDIHVANSLEEDSATRTLPLFAGDTPRLRQCSFASFDFGWDPRLVTDLRTLKLDGYWSASSPSTSTLLEIFRSSPRLEEFVLRNLYDVDSDFCLSGRFNAESFARSSIRPVVIAPAHIVHLPSLRRIVISAAGSTRVRGLLSQLALPALEDLELSCLDDVSVILSHLESQAMTSLPLRRLKIESCNFDQIQLLHLLRRVPTLRTLELVDVHNLSPHFLKALSTPSLGQSWLCPELVTLSIEGCSGIEWTSLRTLVDSRMPSHSRSFQTISQLQPDWSSELSTAAVAPVRRFIEPPMPSMRVRSMSSPPCDDSMMAWPSRLRFLDVSRCPQISKLMISWLKRVGCAVKSDDPSPL